MKLPKYKKKWTKDIETDGFDGNYVVYLKAEKQSYVVNFFESKEIKIIFQNKITGYDNLYFFELFKYLKKLENYILNSNPASGISKKTINDAKIHLLKKVNKVLSKDLSLEPRNKMFLLNSYSKLVNELFEMVQDNWNFKLVIQKKIGYKYYQKVTYY